MEDANNDAQAVENESTEIVSDETTSTEEGTPSIEDLQAEILRLTTHNNTLIGEKRSVQAAKEKADADAAAIKLAADIATAKAAGDMDTFEQTLRETIKAEYVPAMAELTALKEREEQRLVTDVVKDTLIAGNLIDGAISVLPTFLQSELNGKTVIENGIAKVGDKTIAQYVTDYLNSPQGKMFVKANSNSGTAAPGGSISGGTDGYTAETYTLTEHSRIAMTDKAKANAISKALGKSYRSQ